MRSRIRFPARVGSLFILGVALASCQGGGPTGVSNNVSLSSTSLVFSIAEEQRAVTIQNFGGDPIDWRLLSTSVSWLTVSPPIGTVGPRGSGSFTVHINRAALSTGTHNASLQVMAGGESHLLGVSVQQGGTAQASFQPASLTLGPMDDSGVIEVQNVGGSTLNWTMTSAAPWADLSPSSGALPPGAVTQVVVGVNRAGLTPGTYKAMLSLTSNGGSPTAELTVTVGESAGLDLDPSTLTFGLSSSQLPLWVVNNGYQTLQWTATPGASWQSLSSTTGQVPPRSRAPITVNVSRSGLSHGLHQAPIRFTSNGGSAAINVSLNAAPSGSTPPPSSGPLEIQVSPVSLDFAETLTQLTLVIQNSGDAALDWVGAPGATWVSMSPTAGRIAPHASSVVTVNVGRTGLTAGTYQSTLLFQSNGGNRSVTVTAKVPAGGAKPGPAPGPTPNPALSIEVTPTALDFGQSKTELSLVVKNKGTATLDWTGQSSNSWLTLSAPSGQVPPGGSQTVMARTSRTSLRTAGLYQSSLQFASNGGSTSVPVSLRVPAPPSPPPSGGSGLSGIDATGATDVTDQLNKYLAGVPDGSVVSLPAGARYRAESIVQLVGKNNVTIEGNGALIFAETDGSNATPSEESWFKWPRSRSHFEIRGGSNIVVRDLMIRGANPNAGSAAGAYYEPFEGQHGFDVRGVRGLLLERVTATDTYGDLLYIAGLGGWSSNITVRDSHFERSGRQGIAITGAESVEITGSYIGEVGRSIIDLEPGTVNAGARNVLFEGNTFGPCRHLLMSSGGVGPNVTDISFIGNHLVAIGLKIKVRAADGSRRSNYKILNNVSDIPLGLPVAAVRFHWVDGIEVRGNYQRMNANRDMHGVSSCASTGASVSGNDFPGSVGEYVAEPACSSDEEP